MAVRALSCGHKTRQHNVHCAPGTAVMEMQSAPLQAQAQAARQSYPHHRSHMHMCRQPQPSNLGAGLGITPPLR